MVNKKQQNWLSQMRRISKDELTNSDLEGYMIYSEQLLALVEELSEQEKRKLAYLLNFDFIKRKPKLFPDIVFKKEIQGLYQRAKNDLMANRELIQAILNLLEPISSYNQGDQSFNPQDIPHNPDWWVKKFGPWHIYFAIVLSGEQYPPGLHETLLHAFSKYRNNSEPLAPLLRPADSENPRAEQRKIDKLNRQIEALQTRLQKEEGIRKSKETELQGLMASNQSLMEQVGREEAEVRKMQRQIDDLASESEKHESRLLDQRKQTKGYKDQLDALQVSYNEKTDEVSRLITERAELKELLKIMERDQQLKTNENDLRRSSLSPNTDLLNGNTLTALQVLDKAAEAAYKDLSGRELDRNERSRMIALLGLLNFLENPAALLRVGESIVTNESTELQKEDRVAVKQDNQSKIVTTTKTESPSFSGTFFRRDHGGYIELETGNTFNITESIVHKLGLQHEAEVSCTATGQGQFEIQLLLQGDDAYSPVQQYSGFIQFISGGWYCVDMNNPELVYAIHDKDIEMQNLSAEVEGLPCLFNLEAGKWIARLARVYREVGVAEVKEGKVSSEGRKLISSGNSARQQAKVKPEPFLKGSTIVVVGGQKKWFEDVVVETGASYIHENGERPDLIAADLRKAQALFLLLTSTSHRASWETIEIAKANEIPYYIIQGSKSNLRNMLWEHKDIFK